jgi:hypothetical protein
MSTMAVGPIQFHTQSIPDFASQRQMREADQLHLTNAKVKNVWSHTSIPQLVLVMRYSVKHRKNITFFI